MLAAHCAKLVGLTSLVLVAGGIVTSCCTKAPDRPGNAGAVLALPCNKATLRLDPAMLFRLTHAIS